MFFKKFERKVLKMKRNVVLVLGVLLILGFIASPCFAQSTNSAFVGTWEEQGYSASWVFRADGTGTNNDGDMVYAVAAPGKIVINREGSSSQKRSYEYYFTDGGKTLVLYAPGGAGGVILKKK
jgi:hypothetical protein